MRQALIAVFLVQAVGCATEADYARYRQQEAENQRQRQIAYRERLERQCDSIGYQGGTDPYRNCILQLHQQNLSGLQQMQGIILNNAIQQQQQALPLCSTLAPGYAGYARAQGNCR